MKEGIYILANDVVYEQLVALLNSIDCHAGKSYPICILPYDDRLDLVKAEIKNRPNVEIFTDNAIIKKWENFAEAIWKAHPTALKKWQAEGISSVYRMGMHRRFCAFDGPFDKFIYLDADILVLDSLDFIFEELDRSEFVVYDFQYKDLSHVYDVNSPTLLKTFSQARIDSELFCAGMYASKKGIFDTERQNYLLSRLQEGEAEILYMNAPDQSILNYMVMAAGISSHNFSRHLPAEKVTGCCVTSPHFQEENNLLYDRNNRLTYLHYIGLSSKLFNRVCAGENIGFPYRDIFLYYRYLHEPDKRPIFSGKPNWYNSPPSLTKRILKKIGFAS